MLGHRADQRRRAPERRGRPSRRRRVRRSSRPAPARANAEEIASRVARALRHRGSPPPRESPAYPGDGAERDELYRHADARLYENKQGGTPPRQARPSRELSWAAALARAVDTRMGVPVEHSSRVAAYAAGIARAARLERQGPREPAHRRDAARRRQGAGARPHPPEARAARTRRSSRRSKSTRRSAPRWSAGSRASTVIAPLDPPLARELRRLRLSGRAERRGDPARLAHPAGGGRVRRDDERPALPGRAVEGAGAGPASAQRRPPVRPAWSGVRGLPRVLAAHPIGAREI